MPKNKSKGSKAERELVKIFTHHSWRAVRVAGSGVLDESPCDIIAAKLRKKGFTIEAKSSRKSTIYISKSQMNDFVTFSNILGLTPVIAARFNREGWLFILPEKLKETDGAWALSLELAKTDGKKFSQFFEEQ